MSSDTTTDTPGADAGSGGAAAEGGPRTYGPAPAPAANGPASPAAPAPALEPPLVSAPAADPASGTAPKSAHKAPSGPKKNWKSLKADAAKALRPTATPSMGSVAYQQPDQPAPGPGPAGPRPPQYGPPRADAVPGGQGPGGPGPQAQQQRPPRPQQAPRGRKARLRIAKVDPWSVMKTTFVLAIALAIVSIVAVALLWSALNALGVFTSLNHTLASIAPAGQTSSYTLSNVLSFSKVISFTALISVVNIVLLTALATLAAYLYNMCSALVGGIEVTLADDTS